VSNDFLAYEPYGLVMRRDDPDFRQAVDQVLARLYRSGAVIGIYQRWFRFGTMPSPALAAMWAINGLPE
jgi:ABC-type amino acid transport substrate-binding protein